MKKYSRYEPTRLALVFWCLFIGIGAVAGSVGMLVAPDGSVLHMQAMLPYFEVLPFSDVLFRDYVFSGISLLAVNGITNLTAAALMLAKKHIGTVLCGVFGVTLMAWICIQFVIFPPNFLSTIYFIFGFIQAATGLAAEIFYRQERFCFNKEDYKNIGTDKSKLVVFFSRMGYTRKAAYEIADKNGADIFEIETSEPTAKTTGFLWCGRFAMHRWEMPVTALPELSGYDSVTICSPVWVFSLASPVRGFLATAKGKIKKADYVLLHHMNCKFCRIADEMDTLLGIKHSGFVSIRCRVGKLHEIK